MFQVSAAVPRNGHRRAYHRICEEPKSPGLGSW